MIDSIKNKAHHVDVFVGRRLRARRQQLDVSQEELAEYVDLTFQQIQKYEKGYNRISCGRLYEFAHFLKTSVGYFFPEVKEDGYTFHDMDYSVGLADNTHANQDPYQTYDPELQKLIRGFNAIRDPKVRSSILAIIERLNSEHE